jgi:hypothetical protein
MSDELLNLQSELLKNEELDVEAHRRHKDGSSEPSDEAESDDEVEAHRRHKD